MSETVYLCGTLVDYDDGRLRPCCREHGHPGGCVPRGDATGSGPLDECTTCGAFYRSRAGDAMPTCPPCRHGWPVKVGADGRAV